MGGWEGQKLRKNVLGVKKCEKITINLDSLKVRRCRILRIDEERWDLASC
jgi:hypothetical protein